MHGLQNLQVEVPGEIYINPPLLWKLEWQNGSIKVAVWWLCK